MRTVRQFFALQKRTRLIATFFILLSSTASAIAPNVKWYQIETEHFEIVYPEGQKELADVVATKAEEAYRLVTLALHWSPKGKTRIRILDDRDESNAYASPMPYNQIVVFPRLPRELSQLDCYDDWLKMLLIHEYTHIVHMDMVRGPYQVTRKIFGRISLPNAVWPMWMIEGLAVYQETMLTSGGRLRSPLVDMVLRAAIVEGEFPTIDQISVFPNRYPGSSLPYLVGGKFHEWIANTYGDRYPELAYIHAGQLWPYLYNQNAKRLWGKDFKQLYHEFVAQLKEQYQEQIRSIEQEGIYPQFERITTSGYSTQTPKIHPYGWTLAYSRYTWHDRPQIVLYDPQLKKSKVLLERQTPGGLAWSPNGAYIVYDERDIHKIFYDISDLWMIRLSDKKKWQITKGMRAFDPAFSPDMSSIVFVVCQGPSCDLAELEFPPIAKEPKFLTDNIKNGRHIQISSPSVSPNSRYIAYSMRDGANRDIWIYDRKTSEKIRITHHEGVDASPAFSPDGRFLLFSSDRTGVYNIYAFDLKSGELFQVTNVLYGAFEPEPHPFLPEFYFTCYFSTGYDICKAPLNPSEWKKVVRYQLVEEEIEQITATEKFEEPKDFEAQKYSALPTLVPTWWLPYVFISHNYAEVGAFTSGADLVRRHAYIAAFLYHPYQERVSYEIEYTNHQLYPYITLDHGLFMVRYEDFFDAPKEKEKRNYYEQRILGRASVQVPLHKYTSLSTFYRILRADAISDIPKDDIPPDTGLFSGVGFGFNFSSVRGFPLSISPEEGFSFSVGSTLDDFRLGSDYDVYILTARLATFLKIPYIHHVLAVRAGGGIAYGDILRQRAFSVGGFSSLLGTSDDFLVRGYPSGAFTGQRAYSATLEYRYPVLRIERGIGLWPIYFRTLWFDQFIDAGDAWDNDFPSDYPRLGIGAEANLALTVSYGIPLSLKLGIAQGLGEKGYFSGYFLIDIPIGF